MSTAPSISVIVPVYRAEPWLDRCLASILAQSYHDFEVLLVDDGSPDRCGAMCDAWAAKDDRIRVFHKPNGGVADARNFGLSMVRGRFVSFVDSDDSVTPDYLERLLGLFGKSPDARLVECGFTVLRNGKVTPHDDSGRTTVMDRTETFARLMYDEGPYPSVWAKLFRAEVFDGLSFPVGHVYEDTWLLPDCIARSPHVVYESAPRYVYALHQDSITTSAFDPRNAEDHFRAMTHLADVAATCGCDSASARRRLLAFARMRTLRQMQGVSPEFRPLAQRLRNEVLAEAAALFADPRLPRRDRFGIRALRMGLPFYHLAWRIYAKTRDIGR